MQIHNIGKALKAITANTPNLNGAISRLDHGARASRTASLPYGLISVEETERVTNSSGVSLVSYTATLTVYVRERVGTAGDILEVFATYWNRIADLPGLDEDYARFVLIHPVGAELGEIEQEDLGKDIIAAQAAWIIKLSEHNPDLGVD